jgi:hypothetical protein
VDRRPLRPAPGAGAGLQRRGGGGLRGAGGGARSTAPRRRPGWRFRGPAAQPARLAEVAQVRFGHDMPSGLADLEGNNPAVGGWSSPAGAPACSHPGGGAQRGGPAPRPPPSGGGAGHRARSLEVIARIEHTLGRALRRRSRWWRRSSCSSPPQPPSRGGAAADAPRWWCSSSSRRCGCWEFPPP